VQHFNREGIDAGERLVEQDDPRLGRCRARDLETPLLTNTWDRDARGNFPRAVVEAVDGPKIGIDPLTYL
jgi:hypothetical protein